MAQVVGLIGGILVALGLVTFHGINLEWRHEYLRRLKIENPENVAYSYKFLGYWPGTKGISARFEYWKEKQSWVLETQIWRVVFSISAIFVGVAIILLAIFSRVAT